MGRQKILLAWMIAGGLGSPWAQATNGYFAIGYGQKSVGISYGW